MLKMKYNAIYIIPTQKNKWNFGLRESCFFLCVGRKVGTGNRNNVSNYDFFSYSGPRVTSMSNSTTYQDTSISNDLHTKTDNILAKIQGISIAKALCKQSKTVINYNGCTVLDAVLKGLYSGHHYNKLCKNRIITKYFGSGSEIFLYYKYLIFYTSLYISFVMYI